MDDDRTTSTATSTVAALTAALASADPTPGGGSAAAVAASLGASLVAMVGRLSEGRPRYEAHSELHAEALAAADAARLRFLQLADEDAAAYAAFRAARHLPRTTAAEVATREGRSARAAHGATRVPLSVVQECHTLIDIAERLVGRSNAAAASDLGVAALLLECAARGAAANALVNLPAVNDEAFASAVTVEVEERLRQIQRAAARIHELVGAAAEPTTAPA